MEQGVLWSCHIPQTHSHVVAAGGHHVFCVRAEHHAAHCVPAAQQVQVFKEGVATCPGQFSPSAVGQLRKRRCQGSSCLSWRPLLCELLLKAEQQHLRHTITREQLYQGSSPWWATRRDRARPCWHRVARFSWTCCSPPLTTAGPEPWEPCGDLKTPGLPSNVCVSVSLPQCHRQDILTSGTCSHRQLCVFSAED